MKWALGMNFKNLFWMFKFEKGMIGKKGYYFV